VNKYKFSDFQVVFKEHPTIIGMSQAFISDYAIPLLFESGIEKKIVSTLRLIKFKENTEFDSFKNIVSGCVKTCMQYQFSD